MFQILKRKGYTNLLLQIGNGKFTPKKGEHYGITIDYYDYKNSLDQDIRAADLIISHAGAGSIMETLYTKKPLLVVINEDLMANHQAEVAEKLAQLNHLYFTNCAKLENDLSDLDFTQLIPFNIIPNKTFQFFLNRISGF